MAVSQPEGALRTVFTGAVSDALFSTDGSKLFVASGSSVFTIDRVSGQVLKEYALGAPLGAMDLSEDGRYIAVVYRPPNLAFDSADVFRIDTTTGAVKEYSFPTGGDIKGVFRDVAFFADGTALLVQAASKAPSLHYDFDQSKALPGQIVTTGATLIPSPDHSEVLLIDGDYSQILDVVTSAGGVIAERIGNPDPFGGASVPPPLSPTGAVAATNDLFIQGSGLFDDDLVPVPPAGAQRDIGGRGMFFSPAGDKLYVAGPETFTVVDSATWKAIATYPLGAAVTGAFGEAPTSEYGNILTVSNDGRYLSAITSEGLQLVDLQTVQPVSTDGDDTITEGFYQYGSGGNDTLGAPGPQYMYGGTGNDTYHVDGYGDRIFENPGEGYDRVFTAVNFFDEGVEEITFTGMGDAVLFGGTVDNVITSGDGNDEVSGGEGNDVLVSKGGDDKLDGGAGADKLTGGTGNDIYIVDDAGDVVTEMATEGLDEVRTTLATYTLGANLNNLTGQSGEGQTLIGNALSNVFKGGGGPDTMIGKGGDDHYYLGFKDVIVEDFGGGRDTLHTEFNGVVLPDHVEDLVLAFNANHAIGNELDNKISASTYASGALLEGMGGNDHLTTTDGDDRLDGGTGADTMVGGKGNDTYFVDNPDDDPVEGEDEGTDRIEVGFSFTLAAHFENLTLTGTAVEGTGNAAANALVGNDKDNVLNGLDGADRLDGGTGKDTLIGGRGSDSYFVDNAQDTLVENAGEGHDEVFATVSHKLGADFEFLTLQGTAAIDGTGNARNNIITGNGANNTLLGLGGDDILSSFGGADVLDGGDGYDTALIPGFGAAFRADAKVTGTAADDLTVQTKFAGPIHLIDVEVLRFSDGEFVWDEETATLVPINGLGQTRAFAGDDFGGAFGGGMTVIGTAEPQDITVLDQAGFVSFDPSFNRGGDVIRLAGNAEDWRVMVTGSSAWLHNGFATVTIPAGTAGATLVFDDGARELRVVDFAIQIGEQTLTFGTPEFLTAPPDAETPADGTDPDAAGRLFLTPGAYRTAGGNLSIFGTSTGDERVSVLDGSMNFDPSFNRGGDTLVLSGEAADYTAVRLGSSVVLSATGQEFVIPVGTQGMVLDFADSERTLVYDQELARITLGDQTIGLTPVALADFG